jgi:hypothetical protein
MSTEKMREEFEAWALEGWAEESLSRFTNGDYCGHTLNFCWLAWQASRKSIVIDLPTEYDCCGGTTSYEIRDMAIEAVKEKGLGVSNE